MSSPAEGGPEPEPEPAPETGKMPPPIVDLGEMPPIDAPADPPAEAEAEAEAEPEAVAEPEADAELEAEPEAAPEAAPAPEEAAPEDAASSSSESSVLTAAAGLEEVEALMMPDAVDPENPPPRHAHRAHFHDAPAAATGKVRTMAAAVDRAKEEAGGGAIGAWTQSLLDALREDGTVDGLARNPLHRAKSLDDALRKPAVKAPSCACARHLCSAVCVEEDVGDPQPDPAPEWLREFAADRANRLRRDHDAQLQRRSRHLTVCESFSFACILRNIEEAKKDDPDAEKKISPVLLAEPRLLELEGLLRTYEEAEGAEGAPADDPSQLVGFERYVADMCKKFIDVGLKVRLARKTPHTEKEGLTVLLIALPDATFKSVLGTLEFERFVTSGVGATVRCPPPASPAQTPRRRPPYCFFSLTLSIYSSLSCPADPGSQLTARVLVISDKVLPHPRTDFEPAGDDGCVKEAVAEYLSVNGRKDRTWPPPPRVPMDHEQEEERVEVSLETRWFDADRTGYSCSRDYPEGLQLLAAKLRTQSRTRLQPH